MAFKSHAYAWKEKPNNNFTLIAGLRITQYIVKIIAYYAYADT